MNLFQMYTLLLVVLCHCLSGCATSALWKGEEYPIATEVVHAEVNQIYVSYDSSADKDSIRYHLKFCIPFKVNNDNLLKSEKISFPEITNGYLIVKNPKSYTTDALQYIETIQLIFKDTLIDINSVYVERYDKIFNLSVAFTSQNITKFNKLTSNIRKTNHIPPYILTNYNYINNNHQDKLGLSTNVKDNNSYFYYFDTDNIPDTVYTKDVNLSEWRPMLTSAQIQLPLSFYLFDSMKDYNNSLSTRLILTPFALVADIATFPFQLGIAIYGPKN